MFVSFSGETSSRNSSLIWPIWGLAFSTALLRIVSAEAALVKVGSRNTSALVVTLITLQGIMLQTTETVSPAEAVSCVKNAGVSASKATATDWTFVSGSCCTLKSQTASLGQVQIASLLEVSIESTVWYGHLP